MAVAGIGSWNYILELTYHDTSLTNKGSSRCAVIFLDELALAL